MSQGEPSSPLLDDVIQYKPPGTLFGQPAALQFRFDAQSGQNGQKLHSDIHATKATAAKHEVFMLVSEVPGRQHVWVGLVGN